MQEKFDNNITKEWVALSDIINNVEENVIYRIQNRGPDKLIALEANSLPDESQEGDLVVPMKQGIYEKGSQNLYFRAFENMCAINITKVG